MSDDDLRAKLTEALTEFWDTHDGCDWTEADAAHALLPVVRAALTEAWDAGWEMRETARLHGREGDNNLNPWREVQP